MTMVQLPHLPLPPRPQLPPHLTYLDKRRQYRCESLIYNDTGQWLDVWKKDDTPEGAPVCIWLPGGAWASASRFTMQGHALMSRLVEAGWVCLAADYRTAPFSRWPAQINDAVSAVKWAREFVWKYNGDPEFVCMAGASAGGHLATLTGLMNEVDAVVSIYGSYDWQSREGLWRKLFMGYLETVVVGQRECKNPLLYQAASPMFLAENNGPGAPQFMVHGTGDVVISVKEARKFAELSGAQYLEIPGAGHGFDLIDAKQCEVSNQAIFEFLELVREGETNHRGACSGLCR